MGGIYFSTKDDKSKIGDEESWAALVFEKCSPVHPHVAYRCRQSALEYTRTSLIDADAR
jgi:hypothetical protein